MVLLSSDMMRSVKVIYHDLDRISYSDALDIQNKYHRDLIDHKIANRDKTIESLTTRPDHHLIFCEHNPVFTLGKSGKDANLLLNEEQLSLRGIEYFKTNRGGDITYHGPGQIVGYPIFDLDFFYHDVHRYVRDLEEVIIRTLRDYGIHASRMEGLTGVWISDTNTALVRKICAIGVHMSRWVTLHGFALNVNTELEYFNGIVPCGIADRNKTVTSMQMELGGALDMESVKSSLLKAFENIFGIEIVFDKLKIN
jgi:lipoyl(octanoyl) transferase